MVNPCVFRDENGIKLVDHGKYGKTQPPFSSALGPETEEQIKLAKDKIRFDLKLWIGDSDARS